MSKVRIIGIIVLIIAIAIVIITVYDADTYSDFADAAKHKGKTVQIIGKLDRQKKITYDSTLNNLSLRFTMIDKKNNSEDVIYYGTKPRDFERLDEVVVTGHMNDSVFVAEDMLLKCPSKYTNSPDSVSKFEGKK